jgi:hypothetical protein
MIKIIALIAGTNQTHARVICSPVSASAVTPVGRIIGLARYRGVTCTEKFRGYCKFFAFAFSEFCLALNLTIFLTRLVGMGLSMGN